jgi:hypothetical protein
LTQILGQPCEFQVIWFPYYSGRVPHLFGNTSSPAGLTQESTVAAEIRAADAALDFFDVLYCECLFSSNLYVRALIVAFAARPRC